MASLPHERHLLIDKGNSYAKVAVVDDGVFSPEVAFVEQLTPETLAPLCRVAPGGRLFTVYSSVGEPQLFAPAYLQEQSYYFLQIDAETESPLRALHYERAQLGADRLALAVGALAFTEKDTDVLVIDIGTAITYEWVSSTGEYLGGNISPGPRTRSRARPMATALLPEVELTSDAPEMGSNTHDAILGGIAWGIVYEIEGYIRHLQSKKPRLKVILTGGYATYFADKVKNVTFVVPDLVLRGLDRLLEYNAQNHK